LPRATAKTIFRRGQQMNDSADGATLASTAYARLRSELIAGALPPGEKLLIRPLADRYGMGPSPVREALNRLTAEGLVRQTDQRGFTNPPLELADLADLTHARCLLNGAALRDAISRGDAAWEEAIVLAHYRLTRTPRTAEGIDHARNPAWESAHRAYHAALIAACESQRIRLMVEQLFDAADRYRIISRASPRRRNEEAEHCLITDAVLVRNADRAVALLDSHVRLTEALVRDALAHACVA
jgi:GntR family carbon starvation induced transcriptional regulator